MSGQRTLRGAERELMNDYTSTKRKRTSARPVLAAVVASFLLGGAIVGYTVYRMTDDPEPAVEAYVSPEPIEEPRAQPLDAG